MQAYKFTSERLGFRLWEEKDLVPFAALNSDPEVMEFFPKPLTTEETKNYITRLNQHYGDYGQTFYAVDTLENGEFIGFIGIAYPTFPADFTPCWEIGWRLKRAAWNKGYATEGAKRCLDYGLNENGYEAIYSFTATINHRSERVMQKIGMQKIGEFDHPKVEDGHRLKRHVLYKVEEMRE